MSEKEERDILFSRSVKAGKRIYYIDVKQSRTGDMYLSLTESKKVTLGEGENAQPSFEKHKIFLYHEDMDNFTQALQDAVSYIKAESEEPMALESLDNQEVEVSPASDGEVPSGMGKIELDIEF